MECVMWWGRGHREKTPLVISIHNANKPTSHPYSMWEEEEEEDEEEEEEEEKELSEGKMTEERKNNAGEYVETKVLMTP